jgi:hypothetical protein
MCPVLRSTSTPMDSRKSSQTAQGRNPGNEGAEAGPRTPSPATRQNEAPEMMDGWNFRLLV